MFINKVEELLTVGQIAQASDQSPEAQITRLEMMLEISRTLNSTLELENLLKAIIKVATQLTDTETAFILLLNRKKGRFYFEIDPEKSEIVESIPVPLDGSLAGCIVKNGDPLILDNIRQDDRRFREVDWITHLEVKTILGVPLTINEKIIGVIEVANKNWGDNFSGDDIHSLTTLGMQAAVAIENALRFQENEQLAKMIQELHPPMNSIIGSSQIMLDSPGLEVQDLQLGLSSINREAVRMARTVDNYLELIKLETGQARMHKQMVSLQQLAQSVIESFRSQTQECELVLAVTGDIPDLLIDVKRVIQVLINLLDNGIKYNRPGGLVELTLSCTDVRIQLSVRDTGIGIAPDDLDLIFEKFYHVKSDKPQAVGAGLGLALTKKIIEAHGGDIWVESEVGSGSTFTFSLPLAETVNH